MFKQIQSHNFIFYSFKAHEDLFEFEEEPPIVNESVIMTESLVAETSNASLEPRKKTLKYSNIDLTDNPQQVRILLIE